MTPSPAAVRLLADLAAPRHRPGNPRRRDSVSAPIRDDARPVGAVAREQGRVVAPLDAEAAVTALRQIIERLWKDPAWRSAWERRFQAGHYADFASLQRVLALILEQAEGHHRRRD